MRARRFLARPATASKRHSRIVLSERCGTLLRARPRTITKKHLRASDKQSSRPALQDVRMAVLASRSSYDGLGEGIVASDPLTRPTTHSNSGRLSIRILLLPSCGGLDFSRILTTYSKILAAALVSSHASYDALGGRSSLPPEGCSLRSGQFLLAALVLDSRCARESSFSLRSGSSLDSQACPTLPCNSLTSPCVGFCPKLLNNSPNCSF